MITRCASGSDRPSSLRGAHGRGGGCHSRAERPGRGRRGGRVASPKGTDPQLAINTQGPPGQRAGVRRHHRAHRHALRRHGARHQGRRPCRGSRQHGALRSLLNNKGGGGHRCFPGAGLQRARHLQAGARHHGAALAGLPGWRHTTSSTTPPASCRSSTKVGTTLVKPCCWWCWW